MKAKRRKDKKDKQQQLGEEEKIRTIAAREKLQKRIQDEAKQTTTTISSIAFSSFSGKPEQSPQGRSKVRLICSSLVDGSRPHWLREGSHPSPTELTWSKASDFSRKGADAHTARRSSC